MNHSESESFDGSYSFLGALSTSSTGSFELIMQDAPITRSPSTGLRRQSSSYTQLSDLDVQLRGSPERKVGNAAAQNVETGSSKAKPGSGSRRKPAATRWDPTLSCTALVVAAGLALAIAWMITSAAISGPPSAACMRYVPKSCLFQREDGQSYKPPHCTPMPCKFDKSALNCPFAANGTFVHERKKDPAAECADAFMEGVRRPLMPSCSTACCDGGLPGRFLPSSSSAEGLQQWQPLSAAGAADGTTGQPACSYFQYSAAEVLHNMQSQRLRLLVVGDSLQHQLHSRLVHMFRGSERAIDYRMFTMARYALCRAADSFVVAPGYDKDVKGIKPGPTLELLPGFFGAAPEVPGCSGDDPPVVIDTMYSAWYKFQTQHLEAYRAAIPADEHLVLVVGVNNIEKGSEVPKEWLRYLDGIRKDVKVIVMSTPSGLVGKQQAERFQHRNGLLKSWAAKTDGVGFVDFDTLSRDPNHPYSCVHDIHWMCWLKWGKKGLAGNPKPEENVLRERRFGVPVNSLHVTTDGQCHDEMNRNLWQVIFNVFMKWQPVDTSSS